MSSSINLYDKDFVNETSTISGETISVKLENINETINAIAVATTNAEFVVVSIITSDDEARYYIIEVQNKLECINISEVNIKSIEISFFKNENQQDENIYCQYITAGYAIDFPPHSKKKTHNITPTREQFFSQSGNYFVRHLPMKKYSIWTVSFDLLTNKDKNLISDFIDNNNFEPFILQVWKEADKSYYKTNPLIIEIKEITGEVEREYTFAITEKCFSFPISPPPYLGTRKFTKVVDRINTYSIAKQNKKPPKYEMTTGFYVITNNKIDFKKGSNDIYQWSISLTFREVF